MTTNESDTSKVQTGGFVINPLNPFNTSRIVFGNNKGSLDFSGDQLKFTGDVDESAKIFFDHIGQRMSVKIAQLERELADAKREIELLRRKVQG